MDTIYKFYRKDEQYFRDLHEIYDKTLLTPKFTLIMGIREKIF